MLKLFPCQQKCSTAFVVSVPLIYNSPISGNRKCAIYEGQNCLTFCICGYSLRAADKTTAHFMSLHLYFASTLVILVTKFCFQQMIRASYGIESSHF